MDLATRVFIKDISLFIKQFYRIAWGVEKNKRLKIQKLQGQKSEEQCFYQNVCDCKKSKCIKQQDPSGLSSTLGE